MTWRRMPTSDAATVVLLMVSAAFDMPVPSVTAAADEDLVGIANAAVPVPLATGSYRVRGRRTFRSIA